MAGNENLTKLLPAKMLHNMKTTYAEYTDSQIIDALVERLGYKQVEIAEMFYIAESSVSEVRRSKKRLRKKVRQAMIDLLETQDNNGII